MEPVVEGMISRPLTRKEKQAMSKFFSGMIGNWQTSLLGFIASAIQAHAGGMNWKSVLSSLPVLLLGIAAKDSRTGSQP